VVTFLTPLASNSDSNSKGSLGHTFVVAIHTENRNQMSFYPSVPHEISVLIELILGHLCYHLTDVPPQPNSPPDTVFGGSHHQSDLQQETKTTCHVSIHRISETTSRVVVFHRCKSSHLFYTSQVISQCQTRVKLNRVFFPR
jgi:hypothetical protein